MKYRRLLLIAAALVGVFSAVALLATNFNIFEVTSGHYAYSMWPGSSPVITWNLNFTGVPANVDENSTGVTPLTVLTNAFDTWQNATYNGDAVTSVGFTFGSASASFPQSPTIDCKNVIGFADPNASTDFATGIIAFASVATVNSAGGAVPFSYTCGSVAPNPSCPLEVCIVDVDIMFNPAATFATASATSSQFDLQSVATHEVGHLLGLDHSTIAHAVMYPYGDTSQIGVHTALSTDDMVGVSNLYPGALMSDSTGIEGTVTVNGAGVYGADVQAIDAKTGNAFSETLTDPSGNFHLRLFNGTYYVYVQSLAPNTSNGPTTIANFKGQAGYGDNNFSDTPSNPTNYTGRYY